MSFHPDPSPLARTMVTIARGTGPEPFEVEDWWDRVSGGSWMSSSAPAAFDYSLRTDLAGGSLPLDDQVLYGKDSRGIGHLVHVSEVMDDIAEASA